MADATGVCYTQSGDVKRYEPARMSYWAFYRLTNVEYGPNNDMNGYQYYCCFNDYFYTSRSNGDDLYYCANPGQDSCMLSYTIDSDGKCNYEINPGRVDHGLDGIEHGATVLGQLYNYSPSTGGYPNYQFNKDNIPLTLNGLTEGTDYICKKYSYGTEEYNELMSYVISSDFYSFDYSSRIPSLKIKISNGDDVASDGFNSFIKNFSNERFMPDIFVVQNYAENYSPADVPSCNIWCYGVVQGYNSIIEEEKIFQIRYSLPIFEYGEDLRIGHNIRGIINCCYIPISKVVPFCSYNETDFNSYSSYIQNYWTNEQYGSLLISPNIPSKLLNYNIQCTMFGPLQYNYHNSSQIYPTEVAYNYTNYVDGMHEYVGRTTHTTMTSRPIGAVDLPINLLDVAYFDNTSFSDSSGNVPYQKLYYNKSLICNIGTNKEGIQAFSCYDMDKLKIGKYSYTAMNIYIPSISYDFSINNNDTTYNFRCILDKDYCNTFAYDPINYYYKIYYGNIENIFVCEPTDYIVFGTIQNGNIDSLYRMDFYVNNVEKGIEPIYYDDETTENTQEFTFTIQGTEVSMKYKFINNFIKRYDYSISSLDNPDIDYNSILNISSDIEFDKIYEGDNTFTITSNLFNKIEDEFNLGFEMVFYSDIGSEYIDIRKDKNTLEKKTLSVNFLWYECTGI